MLHRFGSNTHWSHEIRRGTHESVME